MKDKRKEKIKKKKNKVGCSNHVQPFVGLASKAKK
jgi:hypothetical protein